MDLRAHHVLRGIPMSWKRLHDRSESDRKYSKKVRPISVRMNPVELAIVDKIAREMGKDRSTILREAFFSVHHLSKEERMKAYQRKIERKEAFHRLNTPTYQCADCKGDAKVLKDCLEGEYVKFKLEKEGALCEDCRGKRKTLTKRK